MVNDLLWPSNRPITSIHQLFDRVQNLGERSSYEFCKQYLPQTLARHGVTAAEHFELPQWHHIIKEQTKDLASSSETGKTLSEVSEELQKAWPRGLRNAAAHREMIYINEENKLEYLTRLVAEYVRILGDEVTASTIERLTAETKIFLFKQREEWMDPAWCHTRDWKLIEGRIKCRIAQWTDRQRPFATDGVDISAIIKLYVRSDDRMYTMIRENGWFKESYDIHYEYNPPVERNPVSDTDSDEDEVPDGALIECERIREDDHDESGSTDDNTNSEMSTPEDAPLFDFESDDQSHLEAPQEGHSEYQNQTTCIHDWGVEPAWDQSQPSSSSNDWEQSPRGFRASRALHLMTGALREALWFGKRIRKTSVSSVLHTFSLEFIFSFSRFLYVLVLITLIYEVECPDVSFP